MALLVTNKTLNLYIKTPDNETLGAWFVLSDRYYQSLPEIPTELVTHVPLAIKHHPTILFLHGNAATRAASARVLHYEAYSSRLGANVLAIDYRGFADSTGTPSEQGLVTDARAAWDWLQQQGAKEDDILIVGHSLGTGVTSQLAAQLSDEGLKPRGIVLLSPFSSIQEVIKTYQFFGLVPLLKPLSIFPYIPDLITRAVVHKFDSLSAVPRIKGPVLIVHAEDDWDIPYTHSRVLFDAFLKPYLPLVDIPNGPELTQESWETFWAQREVWTQKRAEILKTTEIRNFGAVEEFEAEGPGHIQPAEGQASQPSDNVSNTQLPYDQVLVAKAGPFVSTHDSLLHNELNPSIRRSELDRDIHDHKRQHSTHHNKEPPVHHDETHSSNFEANGLSDSGLLEVPTEDSVPLNPTDFVYLPPMPIPPSADTNSNNDLPAGTCLPHPSSMSPTSEEALVYLSSSASSSSFSGSAMDSAHLSSGSATSQAEEHVSFRFEHREDANGNHVIVGREGVLQKCEDEPICTPGSVQAFGVLIAVQEMEDTLIVRQVSENSTELLGLSPRYLFSLDCFTDTLPDTQANLLWENIPDPSDNKDEDNAPQVFLLSGWGAPGTGFSESGSDRCFWTCWCAIHRPTLTKDSSSLMSDLLIIEFELEMDSLNPLYPPLRAEESPSSSGLNRTIASSSADCQPLGKTSTEDMATPDTSQNGMEGGPWAPSPEDIQESTTIYSKTIPALERLRKMTNTTASNAPRIRRFKQHHAIKGHKHLSFGMMDMFAVLSQINEQLGAVNSLELFLKVVVGIIKDLTQFHRVMVYQFDESWNGQVVAELVDWMQTRDLYKGLHFPATDIPAQARALYVMNKVRILYNRSQTTARLVVKSKEDLHVPLTGYIVSNTDDLLGLFDADFGILVIGGGAKVIGAGHQGQETLIMAEYLRLKKFNQGTDFIAFLRRGQLREVRWAGKPYKEVNEHGRSLEPRKSFKTWSEIVDGRSRQWTDEQLETAGVLALVYGKFIEVWRQKENALQTTRLTEILLSNAIRTPLNHIINYLEMALDGPLDSVARENLSRSHAASKDLTRLESGRQTSFNEPFNLQETIEKATRLYRKEASRRDIEFRLEIEDSPSIVVGDATKIQTVVQNLTANACMSTAKIPRLRIHPVIVVKYTLDGTITVSCVASDELEDTRLSNQIVVDIAVADTGIGMSTERLEGIFRDLEKVDTLESKAPRSAGLGLGLAVVARIAEQLDGQLRVDSKIGAGSRFSLLIPLALSSDPILPPLSLSPVGTGISSPARFIHPRRRSNGKSDDVDSFVEAMVGSGGSAPFSQNRIETEEHAPPIKAVKVDTFAAEVQTMARRYQAHMPIVPSPREYTTAEHPFLRILIVEDNDVNRLILAKRLTLDHHTVVNTTNGQEGFDKFQSDRGFDVVLMDLQMPILNGFEATQKIRELERTSPSSLMRPAHRINGRIPIFAVSASLVEKQHNELVQIGMDGWILKPIDFHRLRVIMKGVTDADQRARDVYRPGCCWEEGGWLEK
ncbi:hypothetical protein C0993_011385 [Termitomyces sp. T159_Od127]|nr:hypothetical protein C0993_011385 [Termitomyces sp. T159_Od127]